MQVGVAIIGCGAIGTVLARSIDEGRAGATKLVALYDLNVDRAKRLAEKLKSKPKVAREFRELLEDPSIGLIVEAASQEAVRQYALDVLRAGKSLMVMSVGALVDQELLRSLWREAEKRGCRIYIPSGAIVGVDGVRAASQAGIESVTLTTRKPPRALMDSPYVVERGMDLRGLKEPVVVFEGKASEAVKHFPRSVNVAATLSLAGVGPDRTVVRIIADPNVDRNIHEVRVKGRFGEIVTVAKNVPSPDNPKTSYLAALSAVDTLRRVTEPILVGA